jgi:hypothetical protein
VRISELGETALAVVLGAGRREAAGSDMVIAHTFQKDYRPIIYESTIDGAENVIRDALKEYCSFA